MQGFLEQPLTKPLLRILRHWLRLFLAPTLLLYGADDAETPPAFGQRYHRLFPQSSFIVMEGRHHFPHLTMWRAHYVRIIS